MKFTGIVLELLQLSLVFVVASILTEKRFVLAQTTTTTGPTTTAAPVPVTVTCTRSTACYPWSSLGPACVRGSRMILRFATEAAPENAENVSGVGSAVTEITYAFCPIVDELQAFNLTDFFRKSAVYTQDSGNSWKHATVDKIYMSAIGFGNQTHRTIPTNQTEGRVLVVDNSTTTPCDRNKGEVGIVNFLVLNVSLSRGSFKYLAGHSQPPGNGFMPTCDSDDICTLDASMKCFGDVRGRKMCGSCYSSAREVSQQSMQIWASYYGTDSGDRTLRSGASNPMNFRKYSLGGVYSSISTAFANLKNSRLPSADDLTPPAPVQRIAAAFKRVADWF